MNPGKPSVLVLNKWRMCPWDTDDAHACLLYKVIKGHKKGTEKVTLSKFVLDLNFVIISIVYKVREFYPKSSFYNRGCHVGLL